MKVTDTGGRAPGAYPLQWFGLFQGYALERIAAKCIEISLTELVDKRISGNGFEKQQKKSSGAELAAPEGWIILLQLAACSLQLAACAYLEPSLCSRCEYLHQPLPEARNHGPSSRCIAACWS